MNENKFDGMGNIYAKFRPNYPKAFIDFLFTDLDLPKSCVFADIGAGTGILTRQLLEKGATVYAVEPNDDMRKVAEDNLKAFPKFIPVKGTAENTTLPGGSMDIITAAQAFHWFDREKFKEECKRILKPQGKILLVWNSRDSESELVTENALINREYCPGFKGFSGGMNTAASGEGLSDFFRGEYTVKTFKNPLAYSKEAFIGRNLSSSYALKEDDENYVPYVRALEALFEKYSKDGVLTTPNYTRCYLGTV